MEIALAYDPGNGGILSINGDFGAADDGNCCVGKSEGAGDCSLGNGDNGSNEPGGDDAGGAEEASP